MRTYLGICVVITLMCGGASGGGGVLLEDAPTAILAHLFLLVTAVSTKSYLAYFTTWYMA